MPTYEYLCNSCGHSFEMTQSFSDDPITTCPTCSGEVRKVYSNVGVVFKGSGFYKTDSRGNAASTSQPATTTSDSSGSTESTKPAK